MKDALKIWNRKHTGKTLADVRKELRRSQLADVVTWRIALNNFYNPFVWFNAVRFFVKNSRRKKTLSEMSALSMGFGWRSSKPKSHA